MGFFGKYFGLAFEKWAKKVQFDEKEEYAMLRKPARWWVYTAMPFIFQISTIIVAIWLFNKIYLKVGFEPTVITLLVLILLSLRRQ
jgi:hypothetical protein